MSTIHHNTIKRAASFGLVVTEDGNKFVVRNAAGSVIAEDLTPRQALQAAIDTGVPLLTGKADKKARKPRGKGVARAKDVDDNGDKTPAKQVSGSIVKNKYRVLYNDDDNNGDRLALLFTKAVRDPETQKLHIPSLKKVASENGVDTSKWIDHLNNGQVSMNVRNVLRAMVKRGEKVTINGQTVATLGAQA